jgi:hypothetical protein
MAHWPLRHGQNTLLLWGRCHCHQRTRHSLGSGTALWWRETGLEQTKRGDCDVVPLLETFDLIHGVRDRLWRLWCGTVVRGRWFDTWWNVQVGSRHHFSVEPHFQLQASTLGICGRYTGAKTTFFSLVFEFSLSCVITLILHSHSSVNPWCYIT